LQADDEPAARVWLERHPARDVQLAAILWRHGCLVPEAMGDLLGWFPGGVLAGVALLGPTTLLSCGDAAALRWLGRQAGTISQVMAPRAMVGAFLSEIAQRPPDLERPALLGLSLSEAPTAESSALLRRGRPEDLGLLRPHCRAVTIEELGVDPEEWQSEAFVGGLRRRLELGRELVWTRGETLLFRAGIGAVGPAAALIEGVWVPPEQRRQGIARAAMAAVARSLIPLHGRVALFVAPENQPARALYAELGFQPGETLSAAFWKPAPPRRRRMSLLR